MSFKILIIDDDPSFRKLLEKRLSSFVAEITVTVCDSLSAARKLLLQTERPNFDLVLVDEHLPDGRGVELISAGCFEGLAVISMSSDEAPEIPGASIQAGAMYFINKRSISEPLFKPLVQGVIDRNKLQKQLSQEKIKSTVIDTVKTLIGTLRHEINNPLGAVLGATYVLKKDPTSSEDVKQAVELVEASGKRIKHVLDQLSSVVALESVTKADHKVFQIPGDAPWETKPKNPDDKEK